jgi:hypothetical protein
MDIKQKATAIMTIKNNIQTFKRLQKELREQTNNFDAVISFNEESLRILENKDGT